MTFLLRFMNYCLFGAQGKAQRLPHINLPIQRRHIMTRDELNRELRMHSATFPAVLIVYGLLVATLIFSAMAIV
jgi:hypothetical protein